MENEKQGEDPVAKRLDDWAFPAFIILAAFYGAATPVEKWNALGMIVVPMMGQMGLVGAAIRRRLDVLARRVKELERKAQPS